MAFYESAAGNKVSELHDMAFRSKGSGSETECGDMACRGSAVGEKVSELHDMEIVSVIQGTEPGGMPCFGSVVYKRVGQLRGMEFSSEKAETKKPKLITDDLEVVQAEEYEDSDDDDVYPYALLYDRNSTIDESGQTFIDLAKLAVDAFINRNVLRGGKLLNLVKVTSVDSNGVVLTLTMTADLKGNFEPEWEEEDPTLEAVVWYGGRDSEEIKARVLTVKVWHREETDDEDAESELPFNDCIESESELETESDEEEEDPNEQFLTEFAELAMASFNDSNPHIPYQVLSLLRATRLFRCPFTEYTIRMTAKLKPPHDAKSNAPVQTFRAVICYPGGDRSQAILLRITIVDPL